MMVFDVRMVWEGGRGEIGNLMGFVDFGMGVEGGNMLAGEGGGEDEMVMI